MPKVSIIMPNHNGEKYIKNSIDSVLNQTYTDFELIIIDDKSTDNSRKIIDMYDDERIKKYYLETNRHVAYTVNVGFNNACGEYIARIDSDDTWKIDKLEKQIKFLDCNPKYGACFTQVNIIDENGNLSNDNEIFNLFNLAGNRSQKEWVHHFFYQGNCLCNPSVLMKKSALDEIGCYYNVAYVPAQDFELWTRLVKKYPIYLLDEKLTNYRWTESEDKISGNDNNSEIAFFNVHTLIKKNLLNNMTNEEFLLYFKEMFVNANSSTDLELEIEKAYLLLNCVNSTGMKWLGLDAFEKLLEKPEALELLEKNYNFNLINYYKFYRSSSLFDTVVKRTISNLESENSIMEDKLNKYINETNCLKKEIAFYSKEIKNITNSLSWRATKPLRKIKSILK